MEKMIQPEEINKKELMEYYGYHGFLGVARLYWFFFKDWILQIFAQTCPHPGLSIMFNRFRGVKIGNHVYIGPRVVIDGDYPHLVTIEDYVSIGMNTMIFAHSNPTCSLEIKQKYYPRHVAPVVIKKGTWVTPGCIILAGVTIGENSVVGTGSVVTKDVKAYSVVAGNPARVIKNLQEKKD
jgi:acetyltransferase-like isoleucine patch superfamily enzyme